MDSIQWIDLSERKPENDQLCYVFDADWSAACFISTYRADLDVFVWYEPNIRNQPSLRVTHWIPLPSPFLNR